MQSSTWQWLFHPLVHLQITEQRWSVLVQVGEVDGELRVNVPTWKPAVSKRQLINNVCCKRLSFYTINLFPVPAWSYGNRMASTRVVVVERVVLLNGRTPTSSETRLQQFTDLTLHIHECMTVNSNHQNISNSDNNAQESGCITKFPQRKRKEKLLLHAQLFQFWMMDRNSTWFWEKLLEIKMH